MDHLNIVILNLVSGSLTTMMVKMLLLLVLNICCKLSLFIIFFPLKVLLVLFDGFLDIPVIFGQIVSSCFGGSVVSLHISHEISNFDFFYIDVRKSWNKFGVGDDDSFHIIDFIGF